MAVYGSESNPVMTVTNTSFATATTDLRTDLVARSSNCKIYVRLDPTATINTVLAGVKAGGFAHTGKAAEGDYLKLMTKYINAHYNSTETADVYTLDFTMEYHDTAEQEVQMTSMISSILSGLSLGDKTQYQKVKAIHDWVIINLKFDYAGEYYSAYDVLSRYIADHNSTPRGRQQAIWALLYRLYLSTDIQARIIKGHYTDSREEDSQDHFWCIVKIGSYYYNLDAVQFIKDGVIKIRNRIRTLWTSTASTTTKGASSDGYNMLSGAQYKERVFLKSNEDINGYIRDSEFDNETFNASYPMTSKSYNASSTKKYTITVVNGTGGMSANTSTLLQIVANPPSEGQRFKKWVLSRQMYFYKDTTPYTSTIWVSMYSSAAVTLTATYE